MNNNMRERITEAIRSKLDDRVGAPELADAVLVALPNLLPELLHTIIAYRVWYRDQWLVIAPEDVELMLPRGRAAVTRINWRWIWRRLIMTRCRHQWTTGDRTGHTACAKCGTWRWFPTLAKRLTP